MAAIPKKSPLPFLHPSNIDRPHLLDKLRLVLQHKVTLVAAPPGYGKTTLVAQFARRVNVPVVWQTLEETDRDFPTLFARCTAALATCAPTLGKLNLPAASTPMEAAALVTTMLRNSLTDPIIYILDDIHYLVGAKPLEQWLRSFVETAPHTCHLILIGRAAPPLPLNQLVAQHDVLAIGQEQLRFTFPEISAIAQQLGTALSPADIHQIATRLAGWPAGSVLALRPLPQDIESLFRGETLGPEALFESFAERMLLNQREIQREFLLASSTLTVMTPALCQEALDLPNSRERLSEAFTDNLFVTQMPGGLTYHPLFREFLQRYLWRTHPLRFAALHEKAARWFEDHNRLEAAFDHYLAAQCFQDAGAIAERAAPAYVAQGKMETVLYWQSQLTQISASFPRLLYTCASIHAERYQFDLARKALSQAEAGFHAQADDLGTQKVRLLQASIDNLQGNYRQAAQCVEAILQQDSLPDNVRAFAFYILGTALLHLGEIDRALYQLESALPLYRATDDAYALSRLLIALEVAYIRAGQFDQASRSLHEAIGINRVLGNSSSLTSLLNNLGYQYHMLGDYARALASFQEGLQIARRIGEKRRECYLLWSMADLQRDRGAYDEADTLYRRALQDIDANEPTLRCSVLISLSTLDRWRGELAEALALAREAHNLAQQHQLTFETLLAHMAIWAVRALQGAALKAQQELDRVARALEAQHAQTQRGQALALCAHAALLCSETPTASLYLNSAILGIDHPANLQPCIAEIAHTPLLKAFVEARSGTYPTLMEGLRQLEIASAPGVETDIPQATDALPTFSLKVSILGQERIERDGLLVPISAWGAADAREMFFYLLLKGAATRDQLGLALWPESSAQQVKAIFHATLHRLRDALGTNTILFEDERYWVNPDLGLWCDVQEFETIVQEARLNSPLVVHTENLWRRAAELYVGDLLPRVDAPWLVAYREALREAYIEALFSLGTCIRKRGAFKEAITTFQKALEVDPYREDIHRAILLCYGALGERSAIHRQMHKLSQLLNEDIGVEPSLETQVLVQSLLS